MKKTEINLDILLPDVPDERDSCIKRMIDLLEGRQGIEKVHLKTEEGQEKSRLCFHYDPAIISLNRVQKLAADAGADFTKRYGHLLIQLEGVRHPRHARVIENGLKKLKGLTEVSVSGTGVVSVEFDKNQTNEKEIFEVINGFGLKIQDVKNQHDHSVKQEDESKGHVHQENGAYKDSHQHDHNHDHDGDHTHTHDHKGIFGKNSELIFSIICGVLLGTGFGLSFIAGLSEWVPKGLYFAAYFFGGFYVTKEAYEAISKGEFEIDFLMLVAAVGAGVLGQWAEGALLLFLFSLGHALEHFAMEKARKSIAALTDLAPKTALLKVGEDVKEVPIEQLKVNDIIIVRPHTKIAADGIVLAGNSSVNQAPITGESIPVDKSAIDNPNQDIADSNKLDAKYRVFSGSINGNGSLEIKVTKQASDSTISRVIKMVNEAQTQKSPTQQFTDKFEKYFVPSVLILVVLLCFAFLVRNETFNESFYRAMAVLVAASPCALAISTPSAVLSGVARAARAGVLVKGGRPLEDLGSLTALAFDKTGTLTEGKPKLTRVEPQNGVNEEELLKITVAVEGLSDHPLAKAIARDGKARLKDADIPDAENMEAILGKGVKATVNGNTIYIGNPALFEALDDVKPSEDFLKTVHQLEEEGNTTMIVRRDKEYIGMIAVMDTPREEAKKTLEALKQIGIRRMVMLTGDNQKVAEAVARQIGISDTQGGLLPEQKVETIKEIRRQENKLAMVGDGVNDAPAMANSTVGIAMGAAGSDVALETADIALMGDKLNLLPFAIGLSRKAKGIIKQNLCISLGVVALLIPLTILGIASIGPAVIAHEGSTLIVVFNALRLLAYKKDN